MIAQVSLHILVLVLLVALLRVLRRKMWAYTLVLLPGTIAHELLHWIVGWLLFAKPTSLSVIPRRADDGKILLGQVGFERMRWWNAAPIGLAPLLLIPVGVALGWYSMFAQAISVQGITLKLLALQSLAAAWPSSSDWRHAMRGMAVFFVLAVCLAVPFFLVQ